MNGENTGRSRTIGILYVEESGRGLTHPFFILILNAIKKTAEERGYDVTFVGPRAAGSGEDYLGRCRELGLDGVCVVCVNFEDPSVKALLESDIPCVTVDHLSKGVPTVLSDNETGVQKLVDYAIKRGHRRIAFIHGHNNSLVTRTRISQYVNTMEYHGIPVPDGYLREGLYDNIDLTRRIVKELLAMKERPTCILLPDDIDYLGAQDAAREMGLRVPADISFAGYDGIPLTQALSPKLTTIRQSAVRMGEAAANRLVDLIEKPGPRKPLPSIFPVELLEGGTVGEVRGESV